jgi:hypothetical protein
MQMFALLVGLLVVAANAEDAAVHNAKGDVVPFLRGEIQV